MPSNDYLCKVSVVRNTISIGGNAIVFGGDHRRARNAVAIRESRRTINKSSILSRGLRIGKILGSPVSVVLRATMFFPVTVITINSPV